MKLPKLGPRNYYIMNQRGALFARHCFLAAYKKECRVNKKGEASRAPPSKRTGLLVQSLQNECPQAVLHRADLSVWVPRERLWDQGGLKGVFLSKTVTEFVNDSLQRNEQKWRPGTSRSFVVLPSCACKCFAVQYTIAWDCQETFRSSVTNRPPSSATSFKLPYYEHCTCCYLCSSMYQYCARA